MLVAPYVFITRMLPESIVKPLKDIAEVEVWPSEDEPVPYNILKEKAQKASGLLTMLSDKIDLELLDNARNLKVVANMAVGYDNIDVPFANSKNITVCNTPDVLTNTTAELTMALLLATSRRICEAEQFLKEGNWKNWSPFLLAGQDLYQKRLGIFGMGRIGQAFAKRAAGFEMDIVYHNRNRNEQAEKNLGATYVSFNELITTSDFVVCLAPLTSETRNLFNKEIFSKMKQSAIFINASRGDIVDEQALYSALNNNDILAAGLDVFQNEPINKTHPLLSLPNVVALPHIGSASVTTRWKMAQLAVDNIMASLQGKTPKTKINR